MLQHAIRPRASKSPALYGDPGATSDHPDRLDAALLRTTGVCVAVSMMVILDITVVAVAQRTFMLKFEAAQAVVAWTMTGFTLALVAVIPVAGWAADRLGTRRVFTGSVLLFTLGSLLCALAPNIALLIVFRVLEGLGGGMLLPLKYSIVTRAAGPKRIGRLLAVLCVPAMLGPICGPVLGGWLIESFGWRCIFLINVPVGLTAFFLAGTVFPKNQPAPRPTFDFIGMLLLSPGLAASLYAVSSIPGGATVTNIRVWLPASVGVALIAAFGLHVLFRANHPLIDLRLFSNRVVALASSALLLSETAFHGAALLLPSCLQQLLHETPLQSGLHLIPKGVGALVTIPIAGYVMDKRGPARVVPIGITLGAFGLGIVAYGASHQMAYSPTLLVGLTIMGMGMGCTMMPLSAATMRALRPHQVACGSTLVNVNYQVAASVGVALMSVIMTTQLNASKNITAFNQLTTLKQAAASRGVPLDPSAVRRGALAPGFAGAVLHDVAHAYGTVFVVAMLLVMLACVPVAFLRNKPRHRGPLPCEQQLRDPFDRPHRIGGFHPRIDCVVEPEHRKPVHQ